MNMKQVARLVMLVCIISFSACMNDARKGASDSETVETDSVPDGFVDNTQADTLLLDRETANSPLPEVIDELFDDFIFSFDQSNRLQRKRILFPLPVVNGDGETHYIQQDEWQHHYLLLHQDFCTVMWNTRKQMEMAQDGEICDARVDQIYLHSRQINSFVFHRDSTSREWMLTEECIIPFEHSDMASFLDFYSKFATDSTYQLRHVTDPLRYKTTGEEDAFDIIEGTINREQWLEFQPELPQDVLVHIAYGQTFTNPNKIYLQMRGISNGLQTLLSFYRDGEYWKLIEFEN